MKVFVVNTDYENSKIFSTKEKAFDYIEECLRKTDEYPIQRDIQNALELVEQIGWCWLTADDRIWIEETEVD